MRNMRQTILLENESSITHGSSFTGEVTTSPVFTLQFVVKKTKIKPKVIGTYPHDAYHLQGNNNAGRGDMHRADKSRLQAENDLFSPHRFLGTKTSRHYVLICNAIKTIDSISVIFATSNAPHRAHCRHTFAMFI